MFNISFHNLDVGVDVYDGNAMLPVSTFQLVRREGNASFCHLSDEKFSCMINYGHNSNKKIRNCSQTEP